MRKDIFSSSCGWGENVFRVHLLEKSDAQLMEDE